jgi:hypothetical protein
MDLCWSIAETDHAFCSISRMAAAVSAAVFSKGVHLYPNTSSTSAMSNCGKVIWEGSSLSSPILSARPRVASSRKAAATVLKSTGCPTTNRLFAAPGVVRARICNLARSRTSIYGASEFPMTFADIAQQGRKRSSTYESRKCGPCDLATCRILAVHYGLDQSIAEIDILWTSNRLLHRSPDKWRVEIGYVKGRFLLLDKLPQCLLGQFLSHTIGNLSTATDR